MRQLKITQKFTNRDSHAMDNYLLEIGKIDLLTPEEEVRLAKLIKTGDDDALEKMVRANLRFVVSVAKQYQFNGLSLSDLVNEGNVGLIKAARRFDETKGFKFISYAVWWIRQAILHAIVEYSRIVRMPVNKVSAYNKVNEAFIKFVQQNEREPSNEELAKILDLKVENIQAVMKGFKRHVSFDAPIGEDDDGFTMLDMLSGTMNETSPDLKLMEQSLKDELNLGLSKLSPREVEVLTSYFGLNGRNSMNLDEIADLYGFSRERVRQIKERALRRMRRSYNKSKLQSYLK